VYGLRRLGFTRIHPVDAMGEISSADFELFPTLSPYFWHTKQGAHRAMHGAMLRLLTYPIEPAVPRRPAMRRMKPSTRPVDPFSRLRQAITPTDDKAQGRPLSQTDVCETYARELCAEPRVIDHRRRPE
jgi:hypothetical protein